MKTLAVAYVLYSVWGKKATVVFTMAISNDNYPKMGRRHKTQFFLSPFIINLTNQAVDLQ